MRLFSLFFILLFSSSVFAQHPCGSSFEDNTAIKNRMLRNRAAISPEVLSAARNASVVRYIPVTIHLVGNTAGEGFADPSKAIEMICKLNNDFADQDLVFYLNGNVSYIYNDIIFADAYNWQSQGQMASYKVNNNLNIFINGRVSQPVAGYYSPAYDLVFISIGSANGSSTTITHEVGHFLSLPHTFYGWEGVDARALYTNSSVPVTVNGSPVEYVTRNGANANCNSAADGFCDTDADYISDRFSCPLGSIIKDPDGVNINPDAALFMSYASDNCQSIFSTEQKGAMLADILSRNWGNLPAPSSTATVNGTNLSPLSPIEGAEVIPTTSTIRLEWDTVGAAGASGWIVSVERVFQNVPIEIVYSSSVSNQNYVDVPIDVLGPNRAFRWKVKPLSPTFTCAASSGFFNFTTGFYTSTNQLASIPSLDFKVLSNPIASKQLKLSINSQQFIEANLSIVDLNGRQLWEENQFGIDAGTQFYTIDLSVLNTGTYLLVLRTKEAVYHQKIVLLP